MKRSSAGGTQVLALLLALLMTVSLAAWGSSDSPGVPDAGSAVTAPAPEGLPRGNAAKSTSLPGIPRGNSKKTKSDPEKALKRYGEITTLVKSVKTPSKPQTKNTKMDNQYGTADWSTAANGYITFTAKGREREFILKGPNDVQAIFEVPKGTSIKVALVDGTGKYRYEIANSTDDGESYLVQYENSFSVKTIDSDLAPFLVSTPWGDYANAPEAAKKAKELWDSKKTQLENVEAIAKWVDDNLEYDLKRLQGSADVYVNPDSVIENGGGVCNEHAKLLTAMLRSQGVPACYVIGNEGEHAWVNAWVELESYTKDGTTYSKGAWILIEATEGMLDKTTNAGYDTEEVHYAG